VGSHRLVRAWYIAVPVLIAASGCHSLQTQPPVDVQVRDAETKAPIDGAQVRVWRSAIHSVVNSGTTGPDGMAHLPAPPIEDSPLFFEAMARGYLPRQSGQPVEQTPSGVILEMYAEPRPSLELVVPTGYRGVVKATVRVQSDLANKPAQRQFSFPVPPSGVVAVVLPPVFLKGITPDIRFRYADGTPLLRDAKDFEVGCRWLKADPESEFVFAIGTQWEADEIRRAMKKADSGRDQLGEQSITGYGRFK
jgi:hypothetical protein